MSQDDDVEWSMPWLVESEVDPDKMSIAQLFGGHCVNCRGDLHEDGSCRFCGGDAPTVQQIAYRRQWLKDHPNEKEEEE